MNAADSPLTAEPPRGTIPAPQHTPPAAQDTPTLFEWPADTRRSLRRQLDIEKLLEVERAAAAVVEPVGRLWRDLVSDADSAVHVHSLDGVMRDALTTMSRLLSVNTVAILLANEAGDELMARAAIGLSEELTLGLGIRAGQGMSGRVLATRRPLVVGDLSAIEVVNPVLRHSGLRSVAAVPLLCEEQPLGVLYAASYEVDRFTDEDADLLQVVADRLAAALDRVRLFERERESRHEAELLAERVGRMQRITALLANVNTAEGSAKVLVDAFETSPGSWRGVWLRQDDTLVVTGDAAGLPPGWSPRVRIGDAAWGDAGTAEHAAGPDAGAAEHAAGPDAGQTRGGALALVTAVREQRAVYDTGPDHSAAVLPIVCRQGCAGVLAVIFEGPHEFSPSERELLIAVVGQAAQAFDRALLAAAERQAAERARFFARAAQALAEADTLADTVERLADLAVGALGEICLIDVVGEVGELVRMVAKHRDPALQPLVDRLHHDFPPDPHGVHPVIAAIRTAKTSWAPEMPDEFLRSTTVSDAHFEVVKRLGFRSYLTVPIEAGGRVLGSVTSVSSSRSFARDDIVFAEQLARQVAAVVDNARRYEAAYRTSQILQSSLLPSELPSIEGVRVATRYLTANRGLEVGGDFYDLVRLPSGSLLFSIGDVAGHDRAAAAQMGHLRTAMRALAVQTSTPGELVASLRATWEILGFERITTAVFGNLDMATGALTLSSAGHYPPLLATPDGCSFLPVRPNPPLGMTGGAAEWRGELEAGSVLFLYTDGAVDERSAGSDASMARLAEAAAAGELSPPAVCNRVVEILDPQRADDVALMALQLIRPA